MWHCFHLLLNSKDSRTEIDPTMLASVYYHSYDHRHKPHTNIKWLLGKVVGTEECPKHLAFRLH